MNTQSRDIVAGMRAVGADSDTVECECCLCGMILDDTNVYSPFATVCKTCADEVCEE